MVDHRTRLILRGRHSAKWYGDGEPRWAEGKKQRPCMNAGRAAEQRKKTIKLLTRHAPTDPRADRVRRRLQSCTADRRCLSGACPECLRAYQRWFVAEVNSVLEAENRSYRIISVVPQDKKPEGGLK